VTLVRKSQTSQEPVRFNNKMRKKEERTTDQEAEDDCDTSNSDECWPAKAKTRQGGVELHSQPKKKKTFSDGVRRYKMRARELYCSTTGLTKQFVETAAYSVLKIVTENLGLSRSTSLFDTKTKILGFIEEGNFSCD